MGYVVSVSHPRILKSDNKVVNPFMMSNSLASSQNQRMDSIPNSQRGSVTRPECTFFDKDNRNDL